MEKVQKQNPYDLLDGKVDLTPQQTMQGQQTQQESISLDQTDPSTTQKSQPVAAHKGPGKFMNGVIKVIARLMGKPDPITGEMQPKAKPVENNNLDKQDAQNTQNTQNTQNENMTSTGSGQKAKEVLAGVENLLASVGNTLEKTANKISNKATEQFEKKRQDTQVKQTISQNTQAQNPQVQVQSTQKQTQIPQMQAQEQNTVSTEITQNNAEQKSIDPVETTKTTNNDIDKNVQEPVIPPSTKQNDTPPTPPKKPGEGFKDTAAGK